MAITPVSSAPAAVASSAAAPAQKAVPVKVSETSYTAADGSTVTTITYSDGTTETSTTAGDTVSFSATALAQAA
ncbi:MAG: hypothetical protein PW788_05525 [Micavibrio sp.]|nr:hypothetical protein [Micavibrio sp.]